MSRPADVVDRQNQAQCNGGMDTGYGSGTKAHWANSKNTLSSGSSPSERILSAIW